MNSNLLVGKFYVMDPAVDDLIYADQIKEGMVVLIESAALRADPNDVSLRDDPAWQNHLMKANRWCEVSNLRVIPTPHEVQIQFVGIYATGEKKVRIYNENTGFYVKKDGLPKPPENTEAEEETDTTEEVSIKNPQSFVELSKFSEKTKGLLDDPITKSFIDSPQPKRENMNIQAPDGPLARALRYSERPRNY